MTNLYLPEVQGEFTAPSIHFDLNSKVFEIVGESFLEDTEEFYQTVLDWLDEFKEKFNDAIVFNFKFFYFNSSSSKAILKILKSLKEYKTKAPVEINWYYPDDNPDLMQEGKDFENTLHLPMNYHMMPS